jgi:hypothetical protein
VASRSSTPLFCVGWNFDGFAVFDVVAVGIEVEISGEVVFNVFEGYTPVFEAPSGGGFFGTEAGDGLPEGVGTVEVAFDVSDEDVWGSGGAVDF